MTRCISGTPISEELLFSALDGEAEQWVSDHLSACSFCRERLNELASVERLIGLTQHPPVQDLLDYDEGFMDSGQAASIEHHLEICAHCRSLLEALRAESDPAAWTPSLHVRSGGASKVVASIHPLSVDRPRVAGFGQHDPFVQQFNTDELEIDLTLAQDERRLTVSGLASAVNPSDQLSWQNAVLTLRQGGSIRATALLNERGRFECSALLSEIKPDSAAEALHLEIVIRSTHPDRIVSIPVEVPN